MANPADTKTVTSQPAIGKTSGKAPISLAPVTAMSRPSAADAKPADAKPVPAPAPTTPAVSKPAPVVAAAPRPVAAAPAVRAEVAPVKPAAPAKAAAPVKPARAKSAKRVAQAKTRIQKAPAVGPAAAVAKVAKASDTVAKAASAGPAKALASVRPVVAANVAAARDAGKVAEAVAAKSVAVARDATKDMTRAVAKAAPALKLVPAAGLATPALPEMPDFVGAMLSRTLILTRAIGAMQAKMLDHACAELKATLGEAETLARTQSAADAVALQAKAVRRGYEAQAAHLKEIAQIAGASLRV